MNLKFIDDYCCYLVNSSIKYEQDSPNWWHVDLLLNILSLLVKLVFFF